ncbi:MAG: hypothetical protein GKR94_10135 [Gammaproteobacteria bacterium]|nr:hypothetical protein [Gammaproteobacteria bacterium]
MWVLSCATEGRCWPLADRGEPGPAAIATELEHGIVQVQTHQFDQMDPASIAALAGASGRVDVLLNNAGILRTGPLLDAGGAGAGEVLRTNPLASIVGDGAGTAGGGAGAGAHQNATQCPAVGCSPGPRRWRAV